MAENQPPRHLSIFVHRASELLTDHEPHGDGLICFSLLSGLAKRGHSIYAYSDRIAINSPVPGLTTFSQPIKTPSNALAPLERGIQANRWLKELERTTKIDLVWRMHPYYGDGCPQPPYTGGRPLVVGPLFYQWPTDTRDRDRRGKPRLGIGIGSLLKPIGNAGWKRTLASSDLIFCATQAQADELKGQGIGCRMEELPVIVNPSSCTTSQHKFTVRDRNPRFAFVGNLVEQKRPELFCEIVFGLCKSGLQAEGVIVGDGPERATLEALCASNEYGSRISFVGKIPNSEVMPLISQCDALVSTSFGEPYGRAIVEAMASGTPAICHRSGGPADFVLDGINGILVNDLIAEAYIGAISDIDIDGWERLSLGATKSSLQWREECVIAKLENDLLSIAAS
jgi:glycosyltransferase involved in cell wall biosynthesis